VSPEIHFVLNIAVAVFAALLGGLIAHRMRQPVIVGYLLAGVVLGPFTPGFIGDRAQISALAEIGVIFLMFALGIEFSLKELARIKGVALAGTTIQVVLLIALGMGVGVLLGWPLAQGLFFGGIISISSTMVILKMLIDRGEVASHHGRVLLGMLIVQDLIVVILIVLLPQFARAGGEDTVAALLLTVLKALAFIAGTVFLGVRVVPPFMARVERLRSPELFLLMAATLALSIAGASALLGLSPALGAFLGGLLLTETEFDHRVIAEVVPMRNLFASLFFVSVGMLINPAFLVQHLPVILALTALIIVAKALATLVAILPFRLGGQTLAYTSLGMIQIGEFSYLLAETGRSVGAISKDLNSFVLASSVLTILLTPTAFTLAPRAATKLAHIPGLRRWFAVPTIALADDTRMRDHVIVAGYGRVGQQVADGLSRTGMDIVIIEDDLHLAQSLRARDIPVIFGDASQPAILSAAHPERAAALVVCLPDSGATQATIRNARRMNATLPILARVSRMEDVAALTPLGVEVVMPEYAGAQLLLEMSEQALGIVSEPSILSAPAADKLDVSQSE